uniref:Uncharacterized protein n=1 Tax=Candidatus Kentrum sp. FM TaxID=2126340 RepID=A0A450W7I3_9GAMM|nr:MAG: hypothetical protein BECKFM1743C_GA0114222_101194 [Candidatus Kentron sp. FM]VFJ60565.1 MAG: hypothetical protein BECKFM1743A_GA0114220_102674 [Candidatus Kentron sp. FM]VFK12985.1 MAG: hypothetical protein BECKFM1743B_GA0114221_102634 [Candidatus Kentron sp. FM]
MKKLSLIIPFALAFFSMGAIADQMKEIHRISKPIAVCKVNCDSFGPYDCEEGYEREIDPFEIENARGILIEGRALARADTCFANGSISADFESETDSSASKQVDETIPCKSSHKFKIDMPFEQMQTGELTLYLRVSDWCTALTKLSIKTY